MSDDVFCFAYFGVDYTFDNGVITVGGENPQPLETVHLHEFYAFSYLFCERRITFVPPLYHFLVEKLGCLPDEPRNYSILSIFLASKWSLLPASLLTDIIYAYAYKNRLRSTPSNLRGSLLSIYGVLNSGGTSVIETTLSVIPLDYFYNGRWKVLRSRNFTLSVDAEQRLVRPISFQTSLPPRQTTNNKQYMFTFTPRVPFETYGPCAQNVCSALSRYLKARPNEDQLFINQFSLLGGIPDSVIQESASLCGAIYDPDTRIITFRSVYKNSRKSKERESVKIPEIEGIGIKKARFLSSFDIRLLMQIFLDYALSKFPVLFHPACLLVYSFLLPYVDKVEYFLNLVSLPHVKQKIYQRWVEDRKTFSKILTNTGSWESKFKWEFGKKGKVGRLYASGDHLALIDKVDCDYSKFVSRIPVHYTFSDYGSGLYMSNPTEMSFFLLPWLPDKSGIRFNYYTQFCDAQNKFDCDTMYRDAYSLPDGTAKFYYFSDDSFLVIKIFGMVLLYEIDISQCDASNSFPIFTMCLYNLQIVGLGEKMKLLMAQAARPVTIRNPSNKDEFVELLSQTFFEFSGIKATTPLNNQGSETIGMSVAEELHAFLCAHKSRLPDFLELIPRAAAKVGFVVTVVKAETFNQVTFLKRAFNGTTSWLVYGCVLRSLGVTEGGLTPEMLCKTRSEFLSMNNFDKFAHLLITSVQGFCNEPNSVIMQALRERATRAYCSINHIDYKSLQGVNFLKSLSNNEFVVSISDLLERYGGEEYELHQLCTYIDQLSPFDVVTSDFLERIFSRDYGSEITLGDRDDSYVSHMSFEQTF
jgi:hypothetical protein